jgi:hypothetical protein
MRSTLEDGVEANRNAAQHTRECLWVCGAGAMGQTAPPPCSDMPVAAAVAVLATAETATAAIVPVFCKEKKGTTAAVLVSTEAGKHSRSSSSRQSGAARR